jgi:hypothetical protein
MTDCIQCFTGLVAWIVRQNKFDKKKERHLGPRVYRYGLVLYSSQKTVSQIFD